MARVGVPFDDDVSGLRERREGLGFGAPKEREKDLVAG